MRAISYGGGKMPHEIISRALELFPETGFTNAYGLTETSSTVALLGPDEHREAHRSDDPKARARLALRYGLPATTPMLITSDAGQSAYISSTEFHDRCLREMGHLPGALGRRFSPFDQEFTPSARALHADSSDPLDP